MLDTFFYVLLSVSLPFPSADISRWYLQHQHHLLQSFIMSVAVSEFRHFLIRLPSQTDRVDEDQAARESSLMSEVSSEV